MGSEDGRGVLSGEILIPEAVYMLKEKEYFYIAICDDETVYAESLREELLKTKYKFDISVFESGEALLGSEKEFQIVFLDVAMGNLNGFQTAELLRNKGYQGFIIFLTSHVENFTEAFRVKSFRYLIKPLQREKLEEALNAIETELEDTKEVCVVYKGAPVFVRCNEIVCIKALRDESLIYDVCGGEHMSNKSLAYWKETMPQHMFFQVHKSYLVAMRYVTGLPKNGVIQMKGKEEGVPVSKRLITAFKEAFFKYARTRSNRLT